jgi:uncharacterized membrane protein
LLSTGKNKNLQIFVNVLRVFAVDLNCSNPEESTDPDKNLTFYFKLSNMGNHLESYKLFLKNMPADWEIKFKSDTVTNDTFLVEPFTTLNIRGIMSVAKGTIVGDYNLTVFAQCTGVELDCQVYSTADINIRVNRVYGIELLGEDRVYNTTPGETVNQYFDVVNLGNYRDFADLEVVTKPDNWNVVLERTSELLLYASDSRDIGISITPSNKATVGDYYVYIRGTIEGDGSNADLKIPITIDRIYGIDIINPEPENEYKPGESWVLNLDVQNLGNDNERFIFDIDDDQNFGKVYLVNSDPIQLKPFYEREVELNLELDDLAIAGKHHIPITVTLESTGENYTFDIGFNVTFKRGIELGVIKDLVVTEPGEEVKFEVELNNYGNCKDNFTFEVVNIPPSWNSKFPNPQSVYLPAFTSRNLTLYFRIPSDESYHDIDLEFRIQSRSNSRTNDILPVTISLQEEKFNPLGMEMESFWMLIIIVIVVVIILITIGFVVKSRRSRKTDNIVRYTTPPTQSSDGSRMIWDEGSEPVGDQYNPPTQLSDDDSFDLQIQKPKTYLQRGFSSPRNTRGGAAKSVNITSQSIQTLPFESRTLKPKQTGPQGTNLYLDFNKPKTQKLPPHEDKYTSPVKKSEPIGEPDTTYAVFRDDQNIDDRNKPQAINLIKEDVVFQEVHDHDDEEQTYEYHKDSDGLTLSYNLPKQTKPGNTKLNTRTKEDTSSQIAEEENNEYLDHDVKIFEVNDGLSFKKPQHYSKNSK